MSTEDPVIKEKKQQFELWSFPVINEDSQAIPVSSSEENEAIASINIEHNPQQLDKQEQEIEGLKAVLQQKIEVISEIENQYIQTINDIDEQFFNQIMNCIKKITEKIIHKELQSDDNTLKEMISSSLKEIKKNDSCTIFLSKTDYELLKEENIDKEYIKFQADPELKKGDYKISTPTGTITAILERRLNAFFELNQ